MESEDFNLPSVARLELLSRIRGKIEYALVKPSFWAICHFADLHKLENLVQGNAEVLILLQSTAVQLVLQYRCKDGTQPDTPFDTCSNLICLQPGYHRWWSEGRFALKPVHVSGDKRELVCAFYWQPHYKHDDKVDLLLTPKSSHGLDCLGDGYKIWR